MSEQKTYDMEYDREEACQFCGRIYTGSDEEDYEEWWAPTECLRMCCSESPSTMSRMHHHSVLRAQKKMVYGTVSPILSLIPGEQFSTTARSARWKNVEVGRLITISVQFLYLPSRYEPLTLA